MAVLDAAFSGEILTTVAGVALALGSLGAVGLAGVTDWILGDDEEPEESATDGGGPMFDDAEAADGGGAAGDEFAFDEDGGGGDAFDDFDVDGDDDGAGGGGAGVADLERRVDELEAEIESVSSTVSTVRTENEQISESVEGIEENVRKLLDIYKMVTKGVNPFVDQEGGDGFSGPEERSLGLFDEDDGEEEPEEDLDEELTDADPDEFFDDDFEDEEADQDVDQPIDEPEPDDGAKSFDDLREEYEEEPEWTEEPDEEDASEAAEETHDDGGGRASDADSEEPEAGDPDLSAMDSRIDRVDEPMDRNVASALAAGPGGETERPTPGRPRSRGAPGREKPYLREVPGGYVADLIVMEWVEFLVTVGGADGAHRAITYYENVEWLVPAAADQLREFVEGHPEATEAPEDDGGDPLSMDHHTRSLRYIARLNGDVHENVLDAWDEGDNRWLHR